MAQEIGLRIGHLDGQEFAILRVQQSVLPQEFGVYPKVTAEAMLDHFAILKGIIDHTERREVVESLLRADVWRRDPPGARERHPGMVDFWLSDALDQLDA